MASRNSIYQLKVSVNSLNPEIWRRVLVRGTSKLSKLHDILQALMGWEDSHLHQFTINGTEYSNPSFSFDPEVLNEKQTQLSKVIDHLGEEFLYEYDFGDNWELKILLEKILQPKRGQSYPRCIAGEFASPPEDSGGAYGYSELALAILDPDHPEHEEKREWVGEDFEPYKFDIKEVNQRLKRL